MRIDLRPKTIDEHLAYVTEECGEVLQAIGKYMRFGEFATDPKTGTHYDNRADLTTELVQLTDACEKLLNKLCGETI